MPVRFVTIKITKSFLNFIFIKSYSWQIFISFSNKDTRKFARTSNNWCTLFCKEFIKNLGFFLKINNEVIFIKNRQNTRVDSLFGPLGLIFQSCFENDKFPSEWNKANVVPNYKKNDKQPGKKYRSTSLLLICVKIFERAIYNKLFHLPNQSGFKPGDSCTNQLLAITHEIYKSFDDGHEVRGAFLVNF